MNASRQTAVLLLLCLLLTGCGQKGSLYLPEEPPPAAPAATSN